MVNIRNILKRLNEPTMLIVGLTLIVGSSLLLSTHASAFGTARTSAMTLGSALPSLRSQVALLESSVQARQIFGAEADAAREEQASIFILPKDPDTARMVSVLHAIAQALREDGADITIDAITFDKQVMTSGDHRALPTTVSMHGNLASVSRLTSILKLAGVLSVSDALAPGAGKEFTQMVESMHTLSLPAAERFLALNLADYAAEPDGAESRLTQDLSIDDAVSLRTFLLKSGLSDVRLTLGEVATTLRDKCLWPMPLVHIDSLEGNGSVWTLKMGLLARR